MLSTQSPWGYTKENQSYITKFERGLGSLLCLLFRPSLQPLPISSPFYPMMWAPFPYKGLTLLSNEHFSLLLSENDIGWQTFTMLFRGRKYTRSPPLRLTSVSGVV